MMDSPLAASLELEPILNYVLIWCGMSVVVGAAAKLLVPGENPHGTLATFLIGFFATILSSLALKVIYERFWDVTEFNPIQPMTLLVSMFVGAVGLFLFRGAAKIFSRS